MEKDDLELGNINVTQKSVQSLLYRVENEDNHTNKFSPSIFMAPDVLRNMSPSSFNPRVVAIGPLHIEDKNVQAFEGQKVSYLTKLLSRIPVPKEIILESCMQKVYSSMEQVKACYVWKKTYDDATIAEMMVVDACFILEFIYRNGSPNEPDSDNHLLAQNVICDLLLLENQIPFFFLHIMFQCTILKFEPRASLIELIYPFIDHHNPFDAPIKMDNISIDTIHHILSLLYECYKPHNYITPSFSKLRIHSAVDLDRAGVSFKPNKNPTWLLGMEVKLNKFPFYSWCWDKPTLIMPIFYVHDHTELILRNLIAYEQLCQTLKVITSFAIAMDLLVNNEEDVAKLVDSKVLINIIGSNEEAANMINNICKEVAPDFLYDEELKTLNKYCDGYWPKHIARMRKTYFSSPWNVIALIAGIILFALTVVQTIFTINGSNN